MLFKRDWYAAEGEAFTSTPQAAWADAHPAQIVCSGPDCVDDNIYAFLLACAFHAQSRIVAVTPYFIPDDALLTAWRIAWRGVRITLLVPARSNHRLADWGRGRALRDLCDAGADIYFARRMVHGKAVLVDDKVALCGSANLDGRSLFLNFELMVAFYDPKDIVSLDAWIGRRAHHSAPYQRTEPSWLRDVGEGACGPLVSSCRDRAGSARGRSCRFSLRIGWGDVDQKKTKLFLLPASGDAHMRARCPILILFRFTPRL